MQSIFGDWTGWTKQSYGIEKSRPVCNSLESFPKLTPLPEKTGVIGVFILHLWRNMRESPQIEPIFQAANLQTLVICNQGVFYHQFRRNF